MKLHYVITALAVAATAFPIVPSFHNTSVEKQSGKEPSREALPGFRPLVYISGPRNASMPVERARYTTASPSAEDSAATDDGTTPMRPIIQKTNRPLEKDSKFASQKQPKESPHQGVKNRIFCWIWRCPDTPRKEITSTQQEDDQRPDTKLAPRCSLDICTQGFFRALEEGPKRKAKAKAKQEKELAKAEKELKKLRKKLGQQQKVMDEWKKKLKDQEVKGVNVWKKKVKDQVVKVEREKQKLKELVEDQKVKRDVKEVVE